MDLTGVAESIVAESASSICSATSAFSLVPASTAWAVELLASVGSTGMPARVHEVRFGLVKSC